MSAARSVLSHCVVCWVAARFTPCKQCAFAKVPCRSAHYGSQFYAALHARAALVEPAGYALEEHTVQTADGYLLNIYRLPRARGEGPPSTRKAPSKRCAMFAGCHRLPHALCAL